MDEPSFNPRLSRLLNRRPAETAPGSAPPSSEVQAIHDYLGLEGFRPRFDGDGDIAFEYEGVPMMLLFDARDAENIRVTTGLDRPQTEAELDRACAAACAVTQSFKFVKIIVLKTGVVLASVEMIAARPSSVIPCIGRAAAAVVKAGAAYQRLVRSGAPG